MGQIVIDLQLRVDGGLLLPFGTKMSQIYQRQHKVFDIVYRHVMDISDLIFLFFSINRHTDPLTSLSGNQT